MYRLMCACGWPRLAAVGRATIHDVTQTGRVEQVLELLETQFYRNLQIGGVTEQSFRDDCLVHCMLQLRDEATLTRLARCMPSQMESETLRPLCARRLAIYLEQHPRGCRGWFVEFRALFAHHLSTWPEGASWRHLHALERLWRAAAVIGEPGLKLGDQYLAFDAAFTRYVQALLERRPQCGRCLCKQPLMRCLWRMQSLAALYGAAQQAREAWLSVGARWLCARVRASVQQRAQLVSNQLSDDSAELSFGSDDEDCDEVQ